MDNVSLLSIIVHNLSPFYCPLKDSSLHVVDVQRKPCLFGRVVELLGYVRGAVANRAVTDHCGKGGGGEDKGQRDARKGEDVCGRKREIKIKWCSGRKCMDSKGQQYTLQVLGHTVHRVEPLYKEHPKLRTPL